MVAKKPDEKMLSHIKALPKQMEKALRFDYSFTSMYQKSYSNIVISGLGGSSIGGAIVQSMAKHHAMIPIIINRNFEIPAFVDENTLFIAISYSGNTEETLTAMMKAERKNADIICITSGGRLADRAVEGDWGKVFLPSELAPRAALGYLLSPIALIMERIGVIPQASASLNESIEILKQMALELGDENNKNNLAKEIAAKLYNSIPMVWGIDGVSEVAAIRWKAQINENAKCPAFYSALPELNHNEIVGLELPEELLQHLTIIILEDEYCFDRIQKLIEILKNILTNQKINFISVKSQGSSDLARLLSLCYLGDFVSLYLAAEYGVDPNPVKVIDYLKAQMAIN